jgi:hypothetical protein
LQELDGNAPVDGPGIVGDAERLGTDDTLILLHWQSFAPFSLIGGISIDDKGEDEIRLTAYVKMDREALLPYVLFGIFPLNTIPQTQILKLGLRIEVISRGNFVLDYP